ncbi:hypothetical protein [Herbaspirillum huttiense]|uniref:hypothetical protein n=1 Tax=Herbaspirillum huttiense TaxID=863372 RepID=UPI0031DD401A
MSSPFEQILYWFNGLAPSQRLDVAALVGSMMPGMTIDLSSPSIEDSFRSQLDELKKGTMAEYGLVICLRALVEYAVVNKRRQKAGWRKNKELLEALGQQHDNDKFKDAAAQMELRGAQWVGSCKKWDDMAARYLTDENLSNFYMRLSY